MTLNKLNTIENNRFLFIFIIFFSLMFAWGVLSTQHYPPSQTDIFIGFFSVLFLSAGIFFWCCHRKIKYISINSYLWLILAGLIAVQPLFHSVSYIDSLLYPITTLTLTALLSLSISNMTNREKEMFVNFISIVLIVVSLLLVITQALQLYFPNAPYWLIMPATTGRLTGNIAQVNQAGFVIAMALCSVIYLTHAAIENKKEDISFKHWIFFIGITFFLSLGIGFSASRAALFLIIASIIGIFFYRWHSTLLIYKILVFYILAIILGYYSGTLLMNLGMQTETTFSSVNRLLNENTLHTRVSLLKEAWMAFSENWQFGIGWNNFSIYGINNAERIEWLSNSSHAHNILAHMSAELGVIGLIIVFTFIALLSRNIPDFFQKKLPSFQVFVFILLTIIALYSLSEYPLWYAKFLFLAAFLISILDKSKFKISLNLNKFISGLCVVIILASFYYIIRYDDYLRVYAKVISDAPYEEKIDEFKTLPNIFGFRRYKEMIYYYILLDSNDMLNERIDFGYRVINAYSASMFIEKQALLLSKAHRKEEAYRLYQALCRMEHTYECPKTIQTIRDLDNGELLVDYAELILIWHAEHPNKVVH